MLALGISAAGLTLALRGVDGPGLLTALRASQALWLILATGCFLAALLVRALRFRLLLDRALALGDAVGVMWIGYAVSNLLPLRAGDPLRAWLVTRRAAVPFWAALPAVALERTLDLAAVALLLMLSAPLLPALNGWPWGGVILILTLTLLALLIALPRLHVPLPARLQRIFAQVQEGLRVLHSPRQSAGALALTALIWGLESLYFYMSLRAFAPQAPLLAGPVLTWATALGVATPAPGGVGPYHLAIRVALTQGFGLAESTAVSYALVVHALQYLANTLPGVVMMGVWGLSWGMLRATSQSAPVGAVEGTGGV